MASRFPSASFALPIVTLVLGGFAAAITYSAVRQPELYDVDSAARMPIPGSADVTLAARAYGLYFGMLNAPSRKAMRAPKLVITIVPPTGIEDPEFVEVPQEVDVKVGRFDTVQVARIAVRAPGLYQVHAESPEESGGSFSIGELPREGDPGRALHLGLAVGLAALVASAVLTVRATRLRGAAS